MTTNSPNSFYGDVQDLIDHCKLRIKVLQNYWHVNAEEMRLAKLDLRSYETTLAALTAYPEYNTSNEGGEIFLEVSKAEYDKCHDDYRWISYPSPPAQLLRQVDLPGYTDKHQCMSTACDAAYEYKLSVIEALRQQGYEVKND